MHCRVVPRRGALRVQALFGGGGGDKDGGGGGGIGGMGNLMENMRKAQSLVQGEAGRVQKELAACAPYQQPCRVDFERDGLLSSTCSSLRAARMRRVSICARSLQPVAHI